MEIFLYGWSSKIRSYRTRDEGLSHSINLHRYVKTMKKDYKPLNSFWTIHNPNPNPQKYPLKETDRNF